MKTLWTRWMITGVVATGLGLGLAGCSDDDAPPPPTPGEEAAPDADAAADPIAAAAEQTRCPVSNGPIDKDVFVEHEGKKVYFCCEGCIEPFKEDPAKYMAQLPQFGGTEDTERRGS